MIPNEMSGMSSCGSGEGRPRFPKEIAMLKKILLTLDGSENAEKALPWVKQFAGREKAQVVLLRVVPLDPDCGPWTLEREEAREYLLRMEKELNYRGIPSKVL